MIPEVRIGVFCTCIRLDCWHPKGECDEPPVIRGGICTTCRFYRQPKCPTCGQVIKEVKP